MELILFRVAGMAVFWIFAGNNVDKKGMFSLLLSSADTQSRPFPFHTSERLGGDRAGQLTPTDPRAIPDQMAP